MQAIVLAGGFGTRLAAIVSDVPKPMAPVAGRPFLEILLTSLARKGFRRVVLSLGHMADKIVTHFGPTFAGMELVNEIESTPLGTGGAIRMASTRCTADHYYVFNGDSYLDLEVDQAEAWWQKHRAPIIVARALPDTERFGRLQTTGRRVTGFIAKGVKGPGLINGGCYVFGVDELAAMPEGKPFSIESDYFPGAVATRRFDYFLTEGQFIDIGVPVDYARAQIELAGVCR
jgi:D-glycero-alpha-D-manno-heptose 1-phosphate guanylyltransferase